MGPAEYTLVILNLILGFAFAYPLAGRFAKVSGKPDRKFRHYPTLFGIYFIECFAFSAGMGTNIFSIALAFAWGIIIGMWMRNSRLKADKLLKTAFYFSLYTSLPAVSILSVPVMCLFGGREILTVEGGSNFGIPDFVPFPANTILIFCGIIALVAIVFKTVITTGLISVFIHFGGKAVIEGRTQWSNRERSMN